MSRGEGVQRGETRIIIRGLHPFGNNPKKRENTKKKIYMFFFTAD